MSKISRIRLAADGKKNTEDRGVEERELAALLAPRLIPVAGEKKARKQAGKRGRPAGSKG